MRALQFHRLQHRLLFFLAALLLAVLGVVFLAVDAANFDNARKHIRESLQLTVGTFEKSLSDRRAMLVEKVRLLSGDFAFKQAFATGERETLLSALDNHRLRVGADVMMLLSIDDARVLADTLEPFRFGQPFPYASLLDKAYASAQGEASGIEFLRHGAYQLVVLPLFTPQPSAWLVIGFLIDDQFSSKIQQSTNTQVSILREQEGVWHSFSSTLTPQQQQALSYQLVASDGITEGQAELDLLGEQFLSLIVEVHNDGDERVRAVLQRSLDEAMRPYMKLRGVFLLVFGASLLLAVAGGLLLAGSVTRPVEHLEQAARRIEAGDYQTPVDVAQRDEVGRLADSFNRMMRGLAERERVTQLLGKVVSPAIAQELIEHGIELGGEEREVSILFSDVRNFTSLCEDRTPGEILSLLNGYFSRINGVIDEHGGVVDKFVGDAVMALFGAPIRRDDSPRQAVLAGMSMCMAVTQMNKLWAQTGGPQLRIGVGINTANVVAGNVGSERRSNYTVIGDGVNLASRLEGITKQYDVDVVVSESTTVQCQGIVFRELDCVRVKGKQRPVSIYQPLGLMETIDARELELLDRYHRALMLYRQGEWREAREAFTLLLQRDLNCRLYRIYLERIKHFAQSPPAADWDGTFTFLEK